MATFDDIFAKLQKGQDLTPEESRVLSDIGNRDKFYAAARKSGITRPDELANLAIRARATDQRLTEDQRRSRDNAALDVYNAGDAAVAGRNVLNSIDQISKGDRELRNLERNVPQYQRQIPLNPYLQNRLTDARIQSETGLAPGARAELNRQNLDAYTKQLQNASAVGGGQAGTYGALAQQAALDRQRANLQVAGLDQQARQQNQAAYDNLIPQDIQQRQFLSNQADERFNNLARPMYFGKLQAANALAQAGRQNLNSQLALLPSLAGRLTREYYDANGQRGAVPMTAPNQAIPQELQPRLMRDVALPNLQLPGRVVPPTPPPGFWQQRRVPTIQAGQEVNIDEFLQPLPRYRGRI